MNEILRKTPLNGWHRANGARMVEFGGWDMPVQYEAGILAEHLATRKYGGLFDVCHMGRFVIEGPGAVAFLQRVLSSDVADLQPWCAQYTLIPNESGGVIDDAYLYRRGGGDYLLVVNAGNREKDWDHLRKHATGMGNVVLEDHSEQMGMVAFQGPLSETILRGLLEEGELPAATHNAVAEVRMVGEKVLVARTGYTGEPVCFELFIAAGAVEELWSRLDAAGRSRGIVPVGLGARDTLRLEAGMPLYGHEFGTAPDGREIPAFAVPLVRIAVSFADRKGDSIGRAALAAQAADVRRMSDGGAPSRVLPRRIRKLALQDKGIARNGDEVFLSGKAVGVVTSGTTTPYWEFRTEGETMSPGDASGRRAIALAYLDADLPPGQAVEVSVRNRLLRARIVARHGRSNVPPYFRPELCRD